MEGLESIGGSEDSGSHFVRVCLGYEIFEENPIEMRVGY